MFALCLFLLEGVHGQEEIDETLIMQINPSKIDLYEMSELEDFLSKLNDQQYSAQEKLVNLMTNHNTLIMYN